MIVEFRSLVRRAALAAPVAEARSWMWALYKPPQKSKRCAAGIFDRVRPDADGHGLLHFWESEKADIYWGTCCDLCGGGSGSGPSERRFISQ
jgi:hypothetical protein